MTICARSLNLFRLSRGVTPHLTCEIVKGLPTRPQWVYNCAEAALLGVKVAVDEVVTF